MSRIISRLETPRLIIELNSDEDPRASLISCQGTPQKRQTPAREEALSFFSAVQTLLFYSSPHPPSNYKVVLKKSLTKIGMIGFFKWFPVERTGAIGFSLDKNFRNQGLMTEAVIAFIEAWFGQGEFHWIEGQCQPENIASKKVLINAGMTYRSTQEEPLYKGSRIYTLEVYGISKDEWLALDRP
ncbi:MAG: GNAT family N-acetyltransferase [Nitrospirae bacterium]|nr:GNAT family N-acetyltransferase [Nitrospirota bacterium]